MASRWAGYCSTQARIIGGAAALCVAALALAGCGGEDGDAARQSEPSATTASSTPAGDVREVTAQVSGRTLTGHCSGSDQGRPAVVLEAGIGAGQNQLSGVEAHLARSTVVCAYDRAGVGASDPPPTRPRPLSEVLADLDAFLAAAKVERPYVLVGQSAGGNIVFMQAQAHPEDVAGFVSMNPVPPYTEWIEAARKVETAEELKTLELPFYRGENEEFTDFTATDRMLTDPLPQTVPYVVMFDEDCGGDTEFCGRVLAPLTKATRSLADVGRGGRFIRAEGAGHEIYATNPELVLSTVDDVLDQAGRG